MIKRCFLIFSLIILRVFSLILDESFLTENSICNQLPFPPIKSFFS